MNSQKLEDPAKLGQASCLQLLKRSPLLGKYSRHSLSRGTTHNNRPTVSNTSASWMGMPNHIHLTALFGVHLRMLPTCKQQSQFCCQYNFYLEQAEVLFQEFPRLLRHAVCWHCTTQPKEERQKNQSCCSAHPERDYLEWLICFQEETGSAKQTSPPKKKIQKNSFQCRGMLYLACFNFHNNFWNIVWESTVRKRNAAYLKDRRAIFSILPCPAWVLQNTVVLVLWQLYHFEAWLELCVRWQHLQPLLRSGSRCANV